MMNDGMMGGMMVWVILGLIFTVLVAVALVRLLKK
jgi:hypothetical protein